MNSRHIFLSCLISLCALPAYSANNPKESGQSHHRLIILSDDSEHVGQPTGSLTNQLLGALQSSESPVLFSISIWQNIIEKTDSLVSGAQLEEEEEKFVFDCAKTISFMLEDSENSIEKICPYDPVMAKSIVVDRINAVLEALKKEGSKDPKISDRVMDYLRCFQFRLMASRSDYDFYKVNDLYYLVVPKKYQENCLQELERDGDDEAISTIESALGLVIGNLELVTDPFSIDWIYFNDIDEHENNLLNALKKIFILSKDTLCTWDIYLSGHGINNEWYQKHCPDLSIIADMTIAEFKEVLNFFDTNISINSFWYATCEGGGKHFQGLVDSNNQVISFPIVCLCLTDTFNYNSKIIVEAPFFEGFLSARDIEADGNTGKWKFIFTVKHKWSDFFSTIENNGFDGNELEWIWKAGGKITLACLENTPLLLRAHSKDIITVYKNNYLRLSKEYCEYLHSVSRSVQVDVERTSFVFLDQLKLDLPYTITSKEVPLLVSVVPGKAIHHLTKVVAKESYVEQFVKMFKPLKGISFDKIFVVDEIVCKVDKEKKYGPLLQADKDGLVTLKDIVITHKGDQLTRFFFKNAAGDLFKVHTTCSTSCKGACLHGFKKIEDEKVKEAYDLYRNKLIQV